MSMTLTHICKDDFLSQTNRFRDSKASINHGDFEGGRENVANRQMFKNKIKLYFENIQIV